MKKKILVFACVEKNIGDDLFIKTLCERYPNHHFLITKNAQYGSLKKISNLSFSSLIDKWQLFCTLGMNNNLYRIIARILEGLLEVIIGKHEIGVTIVGNAFKNLDYKGWKDSYYIRARMRLVKKMYFLSTNFGPYTNEQWKKDHDIIFSKMEDVCFRDEESYNLFKNLTNIRFEPDAIFSLGRIERNNIEQKRILISIIDCKFRARNDYLKSLSDSYEEFIKRIACFYLEKGYQITILNSNTIQDSPAAQRIYSQLDENENVEIVNYEGNVEEIFELYKNVDCVIATRLHPIILSFLHDIPIIPISYDIKVKNMLKACGFDGVFYEMDELDNITAENVYYNLKNYNFKISDEIVKKANRQFLNLDKELKN